MLESLFKYPAVLTRHRIAPLFEERARYLEHSRVARTIPCYVSPESFYRLFSF
jgi:hypothetical protein